MHYIFDARNNQKGITLDLVSFVKKIPFGLFAEYLTIIIYSLKFYRILHHRMRKYSGEIDIIAVRGREIVFIEVKARNSYDFDQQILTLHQQKRIKRAATTYIAANPGFANYQVRFDLVIIMPFKVPRIIKNAW